MVTKSGVRGTLEGVLDHSVWHGLAGRIDMHTHTTVEEEVWDTVNAALEVVYLALFWQHSVMFREDAVEP